MRATPEAATVGIDPDRHQDSTNPYMRQFPCRWIAPLPDGLAEAQEKLDALREEAARLPAAIAGAAGTGDGMAMVELRGRQAQLSTLLQAAELEVLTLQIIHAEASRRLIRPHLDRLRKEQVEAAREVVEARQRQRHIRLALQALDSAGAAIDRRSRLAMRRKADVLGPPVGNPIVASIQRNLAGKGSESTTRAEPVGPRTPRQKTR